MKFQLTGTDFIENHHIYEMIHNFMMVNEGNRKPEYIIIHPATDYKIQAAVSVHTELAYSVINRSYTDDQPKITLYGVSLLRSHDVEEDFILIV